MPLSDALRELVVSGAPLDRIRSVADAEGMTSLRADGYAKAARGVTTLEEVLRVTRDEVAP